MTRTPLKWGVLALMLTLGCTTPWWLSRVLIYAPSASLPKGWYVRAFSARAVQVGDRVVLDVPGAMAPYMPLDVPHVRLLKHVAALGGDTVCWERQVMTIMTPQGTARYPVHPEGPAVRQPDGCHALGADTLVIVGTHPRSFDSRYVGAVSLRLVRFRVVPLWTWRIA